MLGKKLYKCSGSSSIIVYHFHIQYNNIKQKNILFYSINYNNLNVLFHTQICIHCI